LARDFRGLVGRKPSNATDNGSEIFAVDVLHGEEWNSIHRAYIEYAADVGMRDLSSDANFGMKARECRSILGESFGKKFYGDDLAELQIFGAIDFAHAAAARQGDNAVTFGDDLARGKAAAADGV
jgi:hypothetical protein